MRSRLSGKNLATTEGSPNLATQNTSNCGAVVADAGGNICNSDYTKSSDNPPAPRRRTGATMSLDLYPPQQYCALQRASPPTSSPTTVTKPLGKLFEGRLPAQTHDTTSIYIAAQRQQRLHKEPTRRSSTNVPPNKSCLSPSPKSEPTSPSKLKRKVSFADDKGLSLTEVRVMKNEINDLPHWTQKILLQTLQPNRNESSIIQTWDTLFPQPASDYLAFRQKIDKNFVALENVIVRKEDDLLTGTVKVKNLTFEKHVFLRVSFDCWTSYCDYPAIFVQQGLSTLPSLFDTFSFSVKVPATASRCGIIEFCVGYHTPIGEYWDSNNGKNFKLALVTRRNTETCQSMVVAPVLPLMSTKLPSTFGNNGFNTWMDFSSWNQILSQGPYW